MLRDRTHARCATLALFDAFSLNFVVGPIYLPTFYNLANHPALPCAGLQDAKRDLRSVLEQVKRLEGEAAPQIEQLNSTFLQNVGWGRGHVFVLLSACVPERV